MTGNEIGAEGAKAMSEMLKVNSTLTTLNLEGEEERRERRERKERRMNDREWDWRWRSKSNEWNDESEQHIDNTESGRRGIKKREKRKKEKERMTDNEIGDEGKRMMRDTWGSRGGTLELWNTEAVHKSNKLQCIVKWLSHFCKWILTLGSLWNLFHIPLFFAKHFTAPTFLYKTIMIHCKMFLIAFTQITPKISISWRHTVPAKIQKKERHTVWHGS